MERSDIVTNCCYRATGAAAASAAVSSERRKRIQWLEAREKLALASFPETLLG